MRWLALQPLRGGSKSIAGKNLRVLAGRPLYAWSLGAALESGCFERIHVATDSGAIAADVRARFGDAVSLFERAPENATDTASSESVMQEFVAQHGCDVLCLIQATSPLTCADDFRQARTRFERDGLDSLFTAVETRRFFWTRESVPLNYDPAARPRRQDFAGVLMENGAFYFTRTDVLARSACRLGGRIGAHLMAQDSALEIDEPQDWDAAVRLLRPRALDPASVRMLVVDVDGTLTDGGMYYDAGGEAMKKFNTRDAKGLLLLRDAGVRVCIVTAENSGVVAARMKKLGITDYFPGVADKLTWLHAHAQAWSVPLAEVAYIGDDINDLAAMQAAGIGCCPADAEPEIRQAATYVCCRAGGAGAVREVCDILRAARAQATR